MNDHKFDLKSFELEQDKIITFFGTRSIFRMLRNNIENFDLDSVVKAYQDIVVFQKEFPEEVLVTQEKERLQKVIMGTSSQLTCKQVATLLGSCILDFSKEDKNEFFKTLFERLLSFNPYEISTSLEDSIGLTDEVLTSCLQADNSINIEQAIEIFVVRLNSLKHVSHIIEEAKRILEKLISFRKLDLAESFIDKISEIKIRRVLRIYLYELLSEDETIDEPQTKRWYWQNQHRNIFRDNHDSIEEILNKGDTDTFFCYFEVELDFLLRGGDSQFKLNEYLDRIIEVFSSRNDNLKYLNKFLGIIMGIIDRYESYIYAGANQILERVTQLAIYIYNKLANSANRSNLNILSRSMDFRGTYNDLISRSLVNLIQNRIYLFQLAYTGIIRANRERVILSDEAIQHMHNGLLNILSPIARDIVTAYLNKSLVEGLLERVLKPIISMCVDLDKLYETNPNLMNRVSKVLEPIDLTALEHRLMETQN